LLRLRPKNPKPQHSQKRESGWFLGGGNFGGEKGWVGSINFQMMFCGREKKVQEVITRLFFENVLGANRKLETLISLLALGVGELGPKKTKK